MKDFPNDTSFREEEQWFLSYDLYLCSYTCKVFVRALPVLSHWFKPSHRLHSNKLPLDHAFMFAYIELCSYGSK